MIIATCARSLIPDIPGRDLAGVVSLRSLVELDRFTHTSATIKPQSAVIAGSGYIGPEAVESLRALGMRVTLLGRNQQVFSSLDSEMSQCIHDYLLAQ